MVEVASSACVLVYQIGTGKKATKFDVIRKYVMRPQPLQKIPTSVSVVILQAISDTSQSIVIWSTVYNIINQSTIIQVQKFKDMMLEIKSTKKVKIPNEVPNATRMIPDSPYRIYVTIKLRQSAIIVASNKDNYRKEQEILKKN